MVTTLHDCGGWKAIHGRLTAGRDLTADEARAALTDILEGNADPVNIAAFIVALRMKGETIDEVTGMVEAMVGAAEPLELGVDAVDIVGTGGSPRRRDAALNVSTMASFVVAGAGVPVCKHGNRRASSTSGSFDLLEALGVTIDVDGPGVARCLDEAGVGFVYARSFHPAMRHAGPVRAELGVPTVFNFLGPLSHPAQVSRQVIGVADPAMAEVVLGVLAARGSQRAMVVHGDDQLDELTTTTTSTIHELRGGEITRWTLDPTDLGIELVTADDLAGGDAAANARIAHEVFAGASVPARDIVALNAAAAIVVAGRVDELGDGLDLARASIDGGGAGDALQRLVDVSAAVESG